MRIYDLKTGLRDDNGEVEVSACVDSEKLGKTRLWFSTPAAFQDCLCTTRMDGFLVGMLFPAMQYGEDIHVAGCVSQKLLFNINNYVIPLLMAFSPSSKRIRVTADEVSAERFDVQGVGTGFSAGVDSFCTIYDRLELENSPDYKVNSFLFLNVGSHGWGESEERQAFARSKFKKRYDYLKQFPEELGLNFIPLDSNLHAFHPWGHLKTDTLTSTAGVLIMQGFYKRYYYGTAGFSYSDQLVCGNNFREVSVADCCDPMIAPLLSTESFDFILDGMQFSRTKKLLHILNYSPVREYLNVCVSGEDSHENCSVCPKCCRTLMALDSIGRIDEFSHLFDIEKYRKKAARRYVAAQVVAQKKDPFARGNVQLAKENGVRLPCLFTATLVTTWYSAKQLVRRIFFTLMRNVLPQKARTFLKKRLHPNGH